MWTLCGLAAALPSGAQPLAPSAIPLAPPSPRFQRFSTDNGLPQSSVRTILQTPDGFLWATTFDGLVRFDGVTFKVWNAGTTPGLSGNRFVTLFAAEDEGLWIGDESGRIFRLKDGAAVAWNEAGQLPGIPLVRRHRSGRILAFAGGGVYELRDGGVHPVSGIPLSTELAGAAAGAGSAPGSGPAWLRGRSLILFEDGELHDVPLPPEALTSAGGSGSASSVFSFYPSTDGGLYVISWNGTIHRYERGRWERLPTLSEMTGGSLQTPSIAAGQPDPEGWPMLKDRKGRLWLAIPAYGLVRRDPSGRRILYGAGDGFSYDRSGPYLFEDSGGSIWVGTEAGLLRFKGDLVTPLSTFEGLPSDNVTSVLEDRNGTIWAGARGGGPLVRVRNGIVERITAPGLDGATTIQTALYEDSQGRIWVGTGSSRMFRYERDRWEELTDVGPLSRMVVHAILEDRDGTMWFGGEGRFSGLGKDGSWRSYTAADGLPSVRVRALKTARDGGLWIATWGGLARLKGGVIKSYREADGLSSDHIRCLYEEPDGTLWIGTYDHGLTRLKHGRFSRITANEGLPSNGVFAILPDQFGRFWMSSNVGITRVALTELNACADGRTARVTAVLYTRDDGMLSSECNGGSQPAGFRTRDGRLLFGSQGGIVVVDPAAQPPSPTPPRVLIESVFGNKRLQPFTPALRVLPGQDEFEIRYTAPSFVKPELIRYEYRLAGLSQTWSDVGPRRSAYFSFVPPGRYAFEVRATSIDGVVTDTPARLDVVVVAPWWKTWPALVAFGILLTGMAALGVRWRIRALSRRGTELEALVKARTDELASKAGQLERVVERLTASELQAREAREAALEASRAKSVFLASMSHELRTPLNAVLGFAQLMDRDPHRGAEDRESLTIIKRSGEHLLGLINDVLSIAKIEAGKASLAEASFDLRRLLLSLCEMVRVRAESKGLAVDVDIAADVPGVVAGDEGKLRQVLLNLLGNAVKFTERGSVMLTVTRRHERIRFEVRDTGPGIPEAEMAVLFGAFVQTSSGRKAGEGTGLGLAISRNLVRLMGGEIEVASEAGKGSVFSFELSLPESAPPAVMSSRGPVSRLAPGQEPFRVLVVDDVPENTRLVAKLLGSVGFQVLEAHDGDKAVAAVQDFRPHLAFMDVRMPGLDGREATRRIRSGESSGGQPCRIVGLSASVFDEERQAFLDAGGDGFIGKPFREEEIFETLERLLELRFDREGSAAPAVSAAVAYEPTAADLSVLPVGVLAALQSSLGGGDVEEARAVCEKARTIDPRVVDSLTELLDRFEVGRLLGLVEDGLRRGGGAREVHDER